MNRRVAVIGAGVGGLATAAVLARAGFDVTVFEAHIYPGGCAGTFYHRGYRFDAGATLAAGFYPDGPMDYIAQATGVSDWDALPAEISMVVHLPGGLDVVRWTDDRRYEENARAFGEFGNRFFNWQEQTADALWNLALRLPDWPPQSLGQLVGLLTKGVSWLGGDTKNHAHPGIFLDAIRSVAAHLNGVPKELRQFVDAQLLISAQALADQTNALYGASALDLPRRGVVNLKGGMGKISERLSQAVIDNGGKVLFRRPVKRIVIENRRPVAIEVGRGSRGKLDIFPADIVVSNLPPWNVARLFELMTPNRLRNLPLQPKIGWGAFMMYLGVDGSVIPDDCPLHHQIVTGEPMGEGKTIFLSISPKWDENRSPQGKRALTISTHTRFAPWWHLYETDYQQYEAVKNEYSRRILSAAERAIPGLQRSVELILPGTPITFERFTHRAWGWVGGFPQTNLFQSWGPRLGPGIWMVGDSIFPGQSTAAVALGGLRVAQDICQSY